MASPQKKTPGGPGISPAQRARSVGATPGPGFGQAVSGLAHKGNTGAGGPPTAIPPLGGGGGIKTGGATKPPTGGGTKPPAIQPRPLPVSGNSGGVQKGGSIRPVGKATVVSKPAPGQARLSMTSKAPMAASMKASMGSMMRSPVAVRSMSSTGSHMTSYPQRKKRGGLRPK